MNLRVITEEIRKPKGKGIIIFDIDDTLVKAGNIFIYKTKDGKIINKLTPEEFAKEDVKLEKEKGFDYSYRDFEQPETLYKSIVDHGIPIIKNLRILDAHLNADWDVGFLTARAGEEANKMAINNWLKYKDKEGNLKTIPQEKIKYFIAINDPKRREEVKSMNTSGDFDSKKAYLEQIQKEYDIVKFVDDDLKNLIKARQVLPKKNVIKAQ